VKAWRIIFEFEANAGLAWSAYNAFATWWNKAGGKVIGNPKMRLEEIDRNAPQ
jgi:hypothetical protein